MRSILSFLVLVVLFSGARVGSETLPPFEINRKYTLVQVGEKGRVNMTYDVSPWGAAGLRIDVYPEHAEPGSQPLRSWTYTGAKGAQRLPFNDMGIGVYRLQGILLDASGKQIAGGDRAVFLEYGGWKAWRAAQAGAKDAPMKGVDRPDGAENASLLLSPAGLVMNAGQSAEINAQLTGVKNPNSVELVWQLEGQGDLQPLSNLRANYRAEKEAPAGKVATIHVFVRNYPALKANLSVVITTVQRGEIEGH